MNGGTVLAAIILILVLGIIIWRPNNLSVAVPTGIGALVICLSSLLSGARLLPIPPLLSWREFGTIFGTTWDAAATLIALFLLSEALDSNNFFEWAALRLAEIAGGSGHRLYLLALVLTTAVTALLANDGAILMLTPIFARLMLTFYPAERQRATRLAIILATGFFADAMSGLFVPSNLTNIILADANHLGFLQVFLWMLLPTAGVFAAAGWFFARRFRDALAQRFDTQALQSPATVLKDRRVFWIGWGALGVLVIGYVVTGQFKLPVSLTALTVALAMVIVVRVAGLRPVTALLKAAPWDILLYAISMFVVITAAYDAGAHAFITDPMQMAVTRSGHLGGETAGAAFVGAIAALLASLVNNLPATLVGVLILHGAANYTAFANYAVLIGVDIGPKLTPFGSLATLLWLGILRRNGITITWREFVAQNWLVTLVALLAAFTGLFLTYLILQE